jgi:hypothetical protein
VEALNVLPWYAWIPFVAIVGGIVSGTIQGIVKLSFRHRERMTMIRMGMHPDAKQNLARDSYEKPAAFQEV